MMSDFDIDGVLYDFVADFNNYMKTSLIAYKYDYFTDIMTVEEFIENIKRGCNEGKLFKQSALEGSNEVIDTLRAYGHKVHIITARGFNKAAIELTNQFLAAAGIEYDSLVFSKMKTVIKTDFFIEDNVDNYFALEQAGTESWLITRPWNEMHQVDRRINTLEEFVEKVGRSK